MIDTGYLFSNEKGRLFVNTSLGCSANCSYCYLPALNYSKGKKLNNYISAKEIIKQVEEYDEFVKGKDGTLISFGCYSECFDEINKKETIELLKYFLPMGNKVQFATKRFVDYKELKEVAKFLQYEGQLTIFISCATITNWDKIENGTTKPEERFKSFEITKKLGIPVVLYIKPVIQNITIKDVDKYIEVIKKYNIQDVVVGSIIDKVGKGEVAPFVNDNSMHAREIDEESIIREKLKHVCNVYTKSIHVLNKTK